YEPNLNRRFARSHLSSRNMTDPGYRRHNPVMSGRAGVVDIPPPRIRVLAECDRRGRTAVVDGCVALLGGGTDRDVPVIIVLGGAAASWALDPDEGGPGSSRWYWVRVWAARGLLWAWEPSATAAILRALEDPQWRVREMAAKVVARHL